MAETSTLQIPKDVLQPIIEAHVATAIAAALGDKDRLIREAVSMSLNTKVGEDGKASHWDTKTTFLQWLVRDSIRKAAEAAVREQIGNDMERIKAAVAKEIKNQKSALTKSIIDGVASSMAASMHWGIRVTVEGKDRG